MARGQEGEVARGQEGEVAQEGEVIINGGQAQEVLTREEAVEGETELEERKILTSVRMKKDASKSCLKN